MELTSSGQITFRLWHLNVQLLRRKGFYHINGHLRHTYVSAISCLLWERCSLSDSYYVRPYHQTGQDDESGSRQLSHCLMLKSQRQTWLKPDKFAPILCPDTMCLIVSMAIERHRTLQQSNCKNAFFQGILPLDEITIIRPPIGDPYAKKDEYWLLKWTFYGIRHSPWHRYTKIKSILEMLGLRQNAYDCASLVATLLSPLIPLTLHHLTQSLSDSIVLTSFTSLPTLWWRPNSNIYQNSTSQSTLWVWLNGS